MDILLIEDNPGDVRLVKEMLREAGNSSPVEAVAGLRAGLDILAAHQPDVVLLDLSLPDSTGLEGLAALQKQSPLLPVVIMTSLDDEAVGIQAVEAGAGDYLVKGQVDARALRRALLYAIERKQLEALKEEFIGLVSHEMRTPLTVIMGGLGTILGSGDRISAEDTRQLLRDAYAESEALANILENLLELSRARSNRLTLSRRPVDIREVAESVAPKLQRQTGRDFTLDFPARLPPVEADRLRVERVFYNLMHNATKYSPAGTDIRVFASLEGSHVRVGVKDHGIGVPPADQAKLFRPFERLEKAAARANIRGTGLGLTVCRRLVEVHGGAVWVESEPDKGSVFFFTLPVAQKPRTG